MTEYKTTADLARALNEAGVTFYSYWNPDGIKRFWDHLEPWSYDAGEGRALLAHDGKRWHELYTHERGVWVPLYGRDLMLKNTIEGRRTVREQFDHIKSIYPHLTSQETDMVDTEGITVKIDVYTTGEGAEATAKDAAMHFLCDVKPSGHKSSTSMALNRLAENFKEAGYEGFNPRDLHWDGGVFVTTVRKVKDSRPELDYKFAGEKIRDFKDGNDLASALNARGWHFELSPTYDITVANDDRDNLWRLQRFYDAEGDQVMAVHNGERWVFAYQGGSRWHDYGRGPGEVFATPPVKALGNADEYLKGLER